MDKKRALFNGFSVPPPVAESEDLANENGQVVGHDSTRRDGRLLKQLRAMYISTKVIGSAAGSAYLEHGGTRMMCAVHGPAQARIPQLAGTGQLSCEFSWAPFALGTVQPINAQDSQGRDYGTQLTNGLALAVQLQNYPKSVIDLHVTVLEDGGNILSCAYICAAASLADAGVMMYDLVTACTVAQVDGQLLADPSQSEAKAAQGDVTVAVMPSVNEVTAVWANGMWTSEQLAKAVELCLDGCVQIHAIVTETLKQSVSTNEKPQSPGQSDTT